MRTERGASQVLFGMLPTQTVDLQGRVWRVSHWADPVRLDLDQTGVRAALLDAIAPWTATDQDGGLADELHARAVVEVVGVNPDRGVSVDPFPKQWRCRVCGRITTEVVQRCKCGASSPSQMQFVAYHICGALREPQLPRCPVHRAVAVRLPGTATARELYFFCPDCRRRLSQGFPYIPCSCGDKGMSVTVHRAGAVFTPHFAVLVNPPNPADAARFRASGGGARALEWVLNGMDAPEPSVGLQTVEGLVEMLVQQGLSMDTARHLAAQALERGEVGQGSSQGETILPEIVRQKAQEEALSLTSAASDGRVRITDMIDGTTPPLRTLYESGYVHALARARLVNVELLTNFPVATLAFGFTRGGLGPGETRLVPFRDKGLVRAYGAHSRTEAILFQLDPLAVHAYLVERGFDLGDGETPREARVAILRAIDVPRPIQEHPQPLGREVLALLHSYAHRLIRTLAATAGVERDALAEYLLPHHLSIVVYAAARGEFVLGGLQALFETRLHHLLDELVIGEHRCALDPGCRAGGGACMACLHLGEPSCRWFNRFLDRATLFGEHGFFKGAPHG